MNRYKLECIIKLIDWFIERDDGIKGSDPEDDVAGFVGEAFSRKAKEFWLDYLNDPTDANAAAYCKLCAQEQYDHATANKLLYEVDNDN